jgi:hypothetical protein
MRTRFREYAREQRRSRVAEILRFAKSLTFRKWRTLGSRAAPRTDEMPGAEGQYQELEEHQLTGSPSFRRSG